MLIEITHIKPNAPNLCKLCIYHKEVKSHIEIGSICTVRRPVHMTNSLKIQSSSALDELAQNGT